MSQETLRSSASAALSSAALTSDGSRIEVITEGLAAAFLGFFIGDFTIPAHILLTYCNTLYYKLLQHS